MKYRPLLVLACTIFAFILGQGQDSSLEGSPLIEASERPAPPDWAIMQNKLVASMELAGDYYWDRFMNAEGTPKGQGPYDDLYEMFYNWPDFYMIGAHERFFSRALSAYNGITRTNTPHPPDSGDYYHRLFKEFPKHDDFFHISEGMTLFYNLSLANPNIEENIQRSRRFAGFYLNEDPDAMNFDTTHHLVKSIFTGSKGPLKSSNAEYNLRYGHASLYPVIEDLEPDWNQNQERKKEIQKIYDSLVTRTDVPVNLGITGLMTHAYLATGDKKYKDWVLQYVDKWLFYINLNNGILPDNIGRSGKIGEYRNGQWWGGLYGWYGRYGVMMMYAAMTVATECAYLISGNEKYLHLLRSQVDQLLSRSITTEGGQTLVPYRRNKEGWHSYRPVMIRSLAHLWHASLTDGDWARIEKVQAGHKFRPLNGEGIWGKNTLDHLDQAQYEPTDSFDWNIELVQGDRTMGKSEYARLMYYAGENPDWPLESLRADYQEMVNRLEFMRNDQRDITDINGDDTYPNNPIIIKALQQTTMGTPQTIYFGGLSRASIRYFDARLMRPGLPNQISALVERINKEGITLHLVNLDPIQEKEIILQAGAFGEHQFKNARILNFDGASTAQNVISINGKYVKVVLRPSTSIRLEIKMNRFVNDPSYRFPWD